MRGWKNIFHANGKQKKAGGAILISDKVKKERLKVKSLSRVQVFVTNGLQPTRFLHPWVFPGKNTGVGCHFLLQEIFPTQGLNPGLLHCRQTLYLLSHQGSSHCIPLKSTLHGPARMSYPENESKTFNGSHHPENPPACVDTGPSIISLCF